MAKSVSAVNVGGVNMKGKKVKRLHCGCCTAYNMREDELKKLHLKEIKEYKSMLSW